MISFIHTADVHFGVENYGRVDPKTGLHSRFIDFVKSFEHCVQTAIKLKVDLFILAGDAYKTANPTPTQQKYLLKHLFLLQKNNIEVVIVVGNHDYPVSFGKAHALDVYTDLPVKGFHVFSEPKSIKIDTKSGPVQIVGIPWPSRHTFMSEGGFRYRSCEDIIEHISKMTAEKIKCLAKDLDPEIPAILTGHLTVSTGVFSGSERKAVFGNDPVLLPSDLTIKPFNYIALGHLHRYQNLNPNGNVPLVYAGSLERIDFGEVRDSKSFCYVKIKTNTKDGTSQQFCQYETIPSIARPMIEIKVELDRSECLTQQIIKKIEQENLSRAILKISYKLPPGKRDTVDIKLIQAAAKRSWIIASINPIHQVISRSSRIDKAAQMNTEELLVKYFQLKQENPKQQEKLILEAKKIIAEAQNMIKEN